VLGAVAEFRKVTGNPTLEFYARFNAAQAMFSRLQDPPTNTSAEQIEAERKRTITDLEQLIERLRRSSGGSVPTTDLEAKATLMAALLAVQGAPDYPKALALTEGFAKRFPGKPELARQAFAIEVLALQKAGNVERAESAVIGYVDTFATEAKASQRIMKRLGREFFGQAEAELAAERPEVAAASARIAIAIYKRLRSELEATPANEAARRGIHAMVGALHAKLGENPAAVEEFTALLALDSRSQEALRGLAEVATQTGDHAKAKTYWTRLATLLDAKDPAWLDARYAAAKAAMSGGDRGGGCRLVKETHDKSPYPLIGKDKARFGELEQTYCTS
jgi:tetratricopeptide (TPR) repeat protein